MRRGSRFFHHVQQRFLRWRQNEQRYDDHSRANERSRYEPSEEEDQCQRQGRSFHGDTDCFM